MGKSTRHVGKSRGVKKSKVKAIHSESKARRDRRLPGQVGAYLVQICQQLLALGAVKKLPVLAASDVLCLYFFCKDLCENGWEWGGVAVAFILAHHIRDPKILKKLCQKCCKVSVERSSETIGLFCKLLNQAPMSLQSSGLPYHIGYARFHTGVPAVRPWLSPEHELKLLVAAAALVKWARGDETSSAVMLALTELPGMANYAYHVLRSWGAVCGALRDTLKAKCKPAILPKKQDNTEETHAQSMSSHVSYLYEIIDAVGGWKQITYSHKRKLPQEISGKSTLSYGDRALLCCDLQGLLQSHVPSWPTQKDAVVKNVHAFCNVVKRNELQALISSLRAMDNIEYLPTASKCRLEGQVLDQEWPAARVFDHSALSLKNLANALPKLV